LLIFFFYNTEMSEKGLSQRKMRILQALVDSYVETAEPVSSAVIHDNFISDVSPATIRSELAKLEELGYIAQPHTSAGRVPLPAAYRLYVDNMLENKPLTEEEISIIEQEFAGRLQEVETLTERTARIISDITNYTSFVIVKGNEEILIKDIKLVPVDEELALVLVITDVGVMRDQFVELPKNIRGEQVYAANRVLKNIFAGKRLSEVKATEDLINFELQDYRDLYERVLNLLKSYAKTGDKVYVEGALKVLDYPEYRDVESAKKFLTTVSDKESISSLVYDSDKFEFDVKIGKEDGLENCALVSISYSVNGKKYGKAGVIGPERMDYNKVISVLNYLARALNSNTDKK